MPAKNLVIHSIECKVHSTGTDIAVFQSVLQSLLNAAKNVAQLQFPVIQEALNAAKVLIEGLVNIAIAIDLAGDYPDQLYLSLSNDPRQNKIYPSEDQPYIDIRSGQIIRPNFIIPFTNAIDINFWEVDGWSDDDRLGRLTVYENHQGGFRYQIVSNPLEGDIYVVVYSVEDIFPTTIPAALLWYKHDGYQNGVQGVRGPLQVGTGWADFKSVFATDNGIIYGIKTDGKLIWYRQPAYQTAAGGFRGPLQAGTGWGGFKSVFATSNGVIYAIQEDGKLRWYKHDGYLNGTPNFASPVGGKEVGTGWGVFNSVFATSNGVIYAIQTDGKLRWYKHNGYLNGTPNFAAPIGGAEIGVGWGDFKFVFSTGNGIIYAIQADGSLLWFFHQGWMDGSNRWVGPIHIGFGWHTFKAVFATSNGVIYGINP